MKLDEVGFGLRRGLLQELELVDLHLRLLQRVLLGHVLGVQVGDLLLLGTEEEEVPQDADHHRHDAHDDVELSATKLHHCPPPMVIDGAAGASGGVVAKGRRLAVIVKVTSGMVRRRRCASPTRA